MAFSDVHGKWILANRILAIGLIVFTFSVSIPLSIRSYLQHGGPWGFGIIGLHILLPLCTYILFAVAALLRNEEYQWKMFIAAHLVSLYVGLIGFLIFPILPKSVLLIPAILAVVGIFSRKLLPVYLCVMLSLGVAANIVLLKWELDFGRRLPIIELFHSVSAPEPGL